MHTSSSERLAPHVHLATACIRFIVSLRRVLFGGFGLLGMIPSALDRCMSLCVDKGKEELPYAGC
jgi:hypothetical protein